MLPGSRPSFHSVKLSMVSCTKFRPYHLSSMFAWRRHAATIADCLPRPDTGQAKNQKIKKSKNQKIKKSKKEKILTWSLPTDVLGASQPSFRHMCAHTTLECFPGYLHSPRWERERRWPMFHWRLPNVRRTSAIITVIGPPSSRLIPTPGWKEKAHYAFWNMLNHLGIRDTWGIKWQIPLGRWSPIVISSGETKPSLSFQIFLTFVPAPRFTKATTLLTILNHHLLLATSFTAHRPDGWLSQASPQSSR